MTLTGGIPDVARLIRMEGEPKKLNINKIIAEAKSRGYKLRKYEFFSNHCLMHYDGSYYRIPLLDSAYAVIADDGEADIYHGGDYRSPLVIKNNIGIAMVMPINRNTVYDEESDREKIIIEVDEDGNILPEEIKGEEDEAGRTDDALYVEEQSS